MYEYDRRKHGYAENDGDKILGAKSVMSAGDAVFLKSIAARQKLIIEDLCRIDARYGDESIREMTSALFSVWCWLQDKSESVGFSAQQGVGRAVH